MPKLTGPLREHCARLAADPSAVVTRLSANLLDIEKDFANASASLRHDYEDCMRYCARLWFHSILTGTFPSPEELEFVAAQGRRRVHQGVPLVAALRAYRTGAREVWGELLQFAESHSEVWGELLFSVSKYLLEFFDVLSDTMGRAYLEEQLQRMRWRESLRHQLATIVFQFPDDRDAFNRSAEALGLDPTVPRVALAIEIKNNPGAVTGGEAERDRITMAISRHLHAAYDDLMRMFDRGRLVIWVPCIRGETAVAEDLRVAGAVTSILHVCADIRTVGIGLMATGARGWATSADEAFKALEYGVRRKSRRRLHLYSDIVMNESVRRAENVLRYFESLLERLAGEPELLTTLQAFFAHHQRRKVTANFLRIHPNTLNHRLERIESLLGAKLEDASWIAKLDVALKLRQPVESVVELATTPA